MPAAMTTPVPHGDGNDSDEDDDLLSSLVQGLGSLRIRSETKHAPKPITIISITAACSGIGSLTVRTKTATSAIAEERVDATSLPAPNITNGSKWRPIADSADDSSPCEVDPVGIPISLTTPLEGEASSPRFTENAAEAPNLGSWKAVFASQGDAVLPPKTRARSTKTEQSSASQAGALIAQFPPDKENKTPADSVDQKTLYATSVMKPMHGGNTIAPESFAHTSVVCVTRTVTS
ncbi:hypothetical protein PHLGIDRAFT_145515 [Phlebiopsis gigantea 11061_1 CR5-6]|uniref:Uncharacterized protein n=1 Tax=Phlebiopsis gigantea (strain 11061_1 CR5-6) TaxID=745531 RepID=A0A0C3S8U3_PHLG1|nr:hypothetical protein PHLGIDRAFT_145515 [Phlebiopsis gigantea 11061_1 CR5-6]